MQRLSKKHTLISIIISFIFFYGCKTSSNINLFSPKILTSDQAYNSLIERSFSKSLKIKYSAIIDNGSSRNKFNGHIKFVNDTLIWANIISPAMGIEIARAMFSTDSVFIIDKVNKRFYSGNYNYLNKKIGFNIDYKGVKNILLGIIYDYQIEYNNNTIEYFTIQNSDSAFMFDFDVNGNINYDNLKYPFIDHSFIIDRYSNLLESEYTNLNNNNSLKIEYINYNHNIPGVVKIHYRSGTNMGSLTLNYKDYDKKVNSYSFSIPKHYSPIK